MALGLVYWIVEVGVWIGGFGLKNCLAFQGVRFYSNFWGHRGGSGTFLDPKGWRLKGIGQQKGFNWGTFGRGKGQPQKEGKPFKGGHWGVWYFTQDWETGFWRETFISKGPRVFGFPQFQNLLGESWPRANPGERTFNLKRWLGNIGGGAF